MFYRMQHNMVSISPADYLAPVQLSRSRRSGYDQMYQVPYARTDVYKYSFFPATVRMWNALPASVIQSGTLSSEQASVDTTATEPRHVTIGHQCVILDHRGLHFTGRWKKWGCFVVSWVALSKSHALLFKLRQRLSIILVNLLTGSKLSGAFTRYAQCSNVQ